MELNIFQKLTEKIDIECFYMTPSQLEEKTIQLIDLHHFIESYNQSLKVVDYISHPINIIEDNGVMKGILFYDLKHQFTLDLLASEVFKKQHQLQELWFVFVEEDHVSNYNRHIDFLIENGIELFYNRIFTFNFFQSVIYSLK
ncbi:hypothetical protein NG800_001510 [Epilithonimonas ginsengisoli]|uniref:Uncharacterized protein n=1 Tax=Epilithonimonas ginsengisoli TaxID=1245592 RepID=A0ABU4JD29_9FLAO|nr:MULTISPECIES: hypothetical protein [Chryseobacterium group]MBV6878543.1 hypothetical protein [Epilithonimonas sp. FP105]MDW8547568.1 hypothetical protein [Epilithonimonas ginsengisoli]OAH75167.1 hypothetical protein AXA65_04135 [Chryseobacterium sp. FP211-J200]